MTILLGADAGGTKVELLAQGPEGAPRAFFGPACNLQRLGNDAAADVLDALVREGLAAFPGATRAVLAAGLSGAGAADDRARLTETLRQRFAGLPSEVDVTVTHDADIALEGAFGTGSGFIVIAGTGSVVMGRTHDGALHRVGGWGYLLGDEGGGYAVGMNALRHLAAVLDGAHPPTRLSQLLQERFALPTAGALIEAVYQKKMLVQKAAPVVCEAARQGGAVALALLDDQAGRLAAQVTLLARTHGAACAPRVALLGGLFREDVYQDVFTRAVRAHVATDGRTWEIGPMPCSPAEGALAMARRLASA